MGELQLSLEGYQLDPLTLNLHEKSPIFNLQHIDSCLSNKVYSDKTYYLKLIGDFSDISSGPASDGDACPGGGIDPDRSSGRR